MNTHTISSLVLLLVLLALIAVLTLYMVQTNIKDRRRREHLRRRDLEIAAARPDMVCDRDLRRAYTVVVDKRGVHRAVCLGCYQEGLAWDWWK